MIDSKCKTCTKLITWKSKGKSRFDCKERQDVLQSCNKYVEIVKMPRNNLDLNNSALRI